MALHCRATHDGLSFRLAKDEEGNLHVLVQSDPSARETSHSHLVDFTYRRPATAEPPEVPFVKRPHSAAAAYDLPTRKRKIKFLETHGNDREAISRLVPDSFHPVRPYYHSKTNLPMATGDWDVDSDDEEDDEWLHVIGEELLDEFEDVTADEKELLKMWNRHVRSHTILGDKDLPRKCLDFVVQRGRCLVERGLRKNLLAHFFNLWDFSLLSPQHIERLMEVYDSMEESIRSNPESPPSPRENAPKTP